MLVISCYIMVLFLFFGTCLFCYSYLHLLHKKSSKDNRDGAGKDSMTSIMLTDIEARIQII